MGTEDIIKECARGWSKCKYALRDEFLGQTGMTREQALQAFADEYGLPSGWAAEADKCIDSDSDACAKAAAMIAAVVACDAATGGACPQCCGMLVGPVLDLLWPVLGPLFEGLSSGVVSLISVGLEVFGLKSKPSFEHDIYWPMRHEAKARADAVMQRWADEIGAPDALSILDDELRIGEPNMVSFYQGSWYPTAYGNVAMPGGDPWKATWNLSWDKAWERDDAYKAAANALGIEYGVRFAAIERAIPRATGRIAARAAQSQKGSFKLRMRLRRKATKTQLAAGLTVASLGAIGVGALWWKGIRR